MIAGRGGRPHDLNAGQVAGLAEKAGAVGAARGHPEAVARAMVDPAVEVLEARDAKTGRHAADRSGRSGTRAGPIPAAPGPQGAGTVLSLVGEEVASYGLGQVVADTEQFKAVYRARGRAIAIEGPGWVHALVALLTDPYVSWMLLFVAVMMLVVELKLPGIGLPAITRRWRSCCSSGAIASAGRPISSRSSCS